MTPAAKIKCKTPLAALEGGGDPVGTIVRRHVSDSARQVSAGLQRDSEPPLRALIRLNG